MNSTQNMCRESVTLSIF